MEDWALLIHETNSVAASTIEILKSAMPVLTVWGRQALLSLCLHCHCIIHFASEAMAVITTCRFQESDHKVKLQIIAKILLTFRLIIAFMVRN